MILRKALQFGGWVANLLRVLSLNLMYRGLRIDFGSRIGRNCSILCTVGSRLHLSEVVISDGVTLHAKRGGSLLINDSFVGPNSVIVAVDSIEIAPGCEIAEMVVIRDQDHVFDHEQEAPLRGSGFTSGAIVLGENVWIGAKATILKSVAVGRNAVVGAHAVVNRDVEPNSVHAGIPARRVK